MKTIIWMSLIVLIHGAAQKKVRITGAKGTVAETVLLNQPVVTHEEQNEEDILTVNKKFTGNDVIIEGDMIILPKEKNVITDTRNYWPVKAIPIQYSPSLNLQAISGIEDARQEYELRTCLSFPDRTDETDYLYFEPLSGCWSYVGVTGGRQTVSIGSGCEGMSTVVHEIMHAIGIYHEQSRTDRDDYIIIETQNVDADKLHNFNKYDYSTVDDRRVAYDFNSVMHYGETAFSNNGEKTIVTRDPKFQHMIGQRRTFSEGDVTKINRMYDCADPLRVSNTCDFDEDTICGYVQDKIADDINWLWYDVGTTDGTQISSSLPQTDGTNGVPGTGSYMVLDTSSKTAGQKGYLTSMRMKSKTPQQCMEIRFYMDLDAGSTAGIT